MAAFFVYELKNSQKNGLYSNLEYRFFSKKAEVQKNT